MNLYKNLCLDKELFSEIYERKYIGAVSQFIYNKFNNVYFKLFLK